MNNWNFTGNLGKDAEQRFTADGKSIVNFSVAVKSGYGDKAATTWARCSMFGDRGGKVLPYLNKGQLVGISGEATLREYEKDGGKGYSLDVCVNDLTLLGKAEGSAPAAAQQNKPDAFNDMPDDTPF